MKIRGLENISTDQVNHYLQQGAKFVVFQYCISVFILTFKRPSDVFFNSRRREFFWEKPSFYVDLALFRLVGFTLGPYLYCILHSY
jgi:hypothetical protein